uniref:Uncharacterized protein n=1 Tax=Ditylenchus dipsaci TaxID=166011 RepID=A0A915E5Q0_9BILA
MIRQLGEPSLNGRGQKIFIPPISIQSCIYISTTELRNSRPFYQNLIRDNNGMIRRASLLEQNEISMFRQRINAFMMSGGNMQAAMSSNQGDFNGYTGGGGQYGAGYNNGPNNIGGQYQQYGGGNSQYGPGNNGFSGQLGPPNNKGAGSNQYGSDYQGFNNNDYGAFLRPPCFCQDCSAGLVLYATDNTTLYCETLTFVPQI